MKPRIVIVHATPRAIGPSRLAAPPEEFETIDILEEKLLAAADDEDASFELFRRTLERAEAGQPAAILTTCSMYTGMLPRLRERIRTPVLGIDEPMIERAALLGGRLALAGSIATAIRRTAALIRSRNPAAETAREHLVAAGACGSAGSCTRLAQELREMLTEFDAIVVVQLSLSPVANFLSGEERERILTSAAPARAALHEMLRRARS